MHPPYTEEKGFAQRYADGGASEEFIYERLRSQYDLDVYVAGTIAQQAIEFAKEKRSVNENRNSPR